jgi:hypothetical protein
MGGRGDGLRRWSSLLHRALEFTIYGSSGGSARDGIFGRSPSVGDHFLENAGIAPKGPNKSAWGRATRHEPRATPQVVSPQICKP